MGGDHIELITFHGWGFSAGIWTEIEEELNRIDGLMIRHADRGYFGNSTLPEFEYSDSIKMVMVHSYGLHWCPAKWIESADHVIIISGFLSFHPPDPKMNRRSKHILRQMKSRFIEKPEEVLDQFYDHVFDPVAVSCQRGTSINHDKLLEDLEDLETSLMTPDLLYKADKVTILHGEDDRIVSNRKAHEMYSMLIKNAQYFEIKHAGHGLLYTHAEECSRFLKPNFELI